MKMTEYLPQERVWPQSGRHILAQFDSETIVVYQAYREEIGRFAVENQRFGGAFSYSRMSWIKPNFLWMMYRSGWGSKPGQEWVLAVRMRREGFETILKQAVHSNYVAEVYGSNEAWKEAVSKSNVRLQWDPDHAPNGAKQERRAIQLGLRGDILRSYGTEWIVEIEDVSEFVREQHEHVKRGQLEQLLVPEEREFPVVDPEAHGRLGIGLA